MGYRLASSDRMLACQALPTNSASTSDNDAIKLSNRMYQEDNKSNASGTSYLTRIIDENTHSPSEKNSPNLSEAT